MNLTQQLEDKKKGCNDLDKWNIVCGKHYKRIDYQMIEDYSKTEPIYLCPKCRAEIAILEQAIAEMQKQRQEILEDELKFLNLGKIKIEGKTKDMEFLIRRRIQYLKQQLNQPKTEKENSKQ